MISYYYLNWKQLWQTKKFSKEPRRFNKLKFIERYVASCWAPCCVVEKRITIRDLTLGSGSKCCLRKCAMWLPSLSLLIWSGDDEPSTHSGYDGETSRWDVSTLWIACIRGWLMGCQGSPCCHCPVTPAEFGRLLKAASGHYTYC